MEEQKPYMMSLYEYLGHAAGSELGKEVAETAVKLKETIEESEEKSFMLSLLVKSKEIINMPEATQETVVETVVEKTVADPVAVVKEANVEQLLKATETAIMKHVDATTRLTTDANEVSALKKQVGDKIFEKYLEIEQKDLDLELNTWFPGLFEDKPAVILCFPYAQHFLSDSPGAYSQLKNEEELVNEIENVDFSKMNIFSTKKFSKFALIGAASSFIINVTLFVLLIV